MYPRAQHQQRAEGTEFAAVVVSEARCRATRAGQLAARDPPAPHHRNTLGDAGLRGPAGCLRVLAHAATEGGACGAPSARTPAPYDPVNRIRKPRHGQPLHLPRDHHRARAPRGRGPTHDHTAAWKLAADVQARLETAQQHLSAAAVQDASRAIARAQELARRVEHEADTTVTDTRAT